ncbi:hypothetical protein Cob_v002526 [Colletotrichum orbiculare MAFF 240422]|uniref:Lysine-specific metallo-endopeptidase domain-containing protein n=1 Tax=Colletotrichum orbiculare (strain 104-T / ATCC 96160 / CBS 514.97 / LARS 414 / MAFF 240422) TaxID=1213857 RepID=A0A484G348_COLOR|nr:hypothetical protein Cob_v002526 [Colletotrichum orbiculare MAFF 240422]
MPAPGKVVHFLLTSLVLATALALPSDTPDSLPAKLRQRGDAKRVVVVGGNIGRNNIYHCSADQVETIESAVQNMRRLAANAYNFLLEDNSHTTAAYIAWFGEKHATEGWAIAIRRNIYDGIWSVGSKVDAYVASLDAVDDAIVRGCATPETEPECSQTETEITHALAYKPDGFMKLCTSYFSLSSDYSRAYNLWGSERREHETLGRALLHEMTHMSVVVGSKWITGDPGYGPDESLGLPDDKKIDNADSFKLFTLEIEANPVNSKRQVDMKLREKKDTIAKRLLRGD